MRWIQKISLCLGLGAIAMASVAHAQQQQFVNVLTGGQSGVYYPLGVALSQVYAKSIPNARATAQVTKASAENLNLLQAGRGELAFTLGDALSDAWKGDAEAGFPKKLDKLRGLSATYNNYIQIVANADAGIKTLADLKGKRISVGAAKSGTELNARAIFKAAGMSYADSSQYLHGPDAGRTHGRHSQLSGDAQWCLRRAGLPDGQADVREPGHVARRPQCRQGHCTRQRHQGHARAVAPRCGALLQGNWAYQVSNPSEPLPPAHPRAGGLPWKRPCQSRSLS